VISSKSAIELQGIARAGGSLKVDGSQFSAIELQGIARALTERAHLVVANSDRLSAIELQGIARAKPGQVSFQ
jgi:hypothetical protein